MKLGEENLIKYQQLEELRQMQGKHSETKCGESQTCSTVAEVAGPANDRLPDESPFRYWTRTNREHLTQVVFQLPVDEQLEHERGCAICQAGLCAAAQSMSGIEIVDAVETAMKKAGDAIQLQVARQVRWGK